MSRMTFERIANGLKEVLSVAQGKTKPAKLQTVDVEDELQETISFQKNVTGINNTLFISPHAIRVAIDPPDSLNPQCRTATISLAGEVVAGDIEPALLRQVREFIERNREVLSDYHEYEIDTDQLRQRLK